ncbi:MAG: response regulator transcription factor [Clostridia bacterium]|nr:response regulator transcription factor [Clostridia bacterium]
MKIAICDNDVTAMQQLKHLLYNYSHKHKLDLFIETFNSGEQLLSSKSRFLVIFIEYSLKGINGLETAKKLRKTDTNAKIIFLTSDTDFIYDAFKVSAYRFFKKPLSADTLYKSLNELFFCREIHYPLWINDGIMTHCINTGDIIYLEADNKFCYVHLKESVILCKKTMARVFEALPKIYFLKINRSFIVNLGFINKYNTESVFLKNGEDLHITRTYYKNFKENYILYSSPKII